jgi:hypothetical protein
MLPDYGNPLMDRGAIEDLVAKFLVEKQEFERAHSVVRCLAKRNMNDCFSSGSGWVWNRGTIGTSNDNAHPATQD